MKIGGYQTHPIADAFPLLEGAAFAELVEDVRRNGLHEAIEYILDGKGQVVIDGRNRLRACLEAKIKPQLTQYRGKASELARYVISKNIHRRHMNDAQRALVAANLARLELGANQHRRQGPPNGGPSTPTTEEAAALLGVAPRTVERAKKVIESGIPAVVASLREGNIPVASAAKLAERPKAKQIEVAKKLGLEEGKRVRPGNLEAILRQEDRREVVHAINNSEVRPLAAAAGPHRVILADPPWPYENSDGHAGSRGHITYPPMAIERICAIGRELEPLIHPAGAILFLWTTNIFLEAAPGVVSAWGFTWRTVFTWTKNTQGTGIWGRGRTEHAIVASRGAPTHTLNEVTTWLGDRVLDRREHSRKPDLLYEVIEKHCPGSKLELFARAPRQNWAQWGAEPRKFEAA